MKFFALALVCALALGQLTTGALARGANGDNDALRSQMAMNAQASNIYKAVNGLQSTSSAAMENNAIAAAVPYGTVPSLYLTNSYEGEGDGYYWGGGNK